MFTETLRARERGEEGGKAAGLEYRGQLSFRIKSERRCAHRLLEQEGKIFFSCSMLIKSFIK